MELTDIGLFQIFSRVHGLAMFTHFSLMHLKENKTVNILKCSLLFLVMVAFVVILYLLLKDDL